MINADIKSNSIAMLEYTHKEIVRSQVLNVARDFQSLLDEQKENNKIIPFPKINEEKINFSR